MDDYPTDWDKIDLTFGIEMPEFESASDETAAWSIMDGIFDQPGHALSRQLLPTRPANARLH